MCQNGIISVSTMPQITTTVIQISSLLSM